MSATFKTVTDNQELIEEVKDGTRPLQFLHPEKLQVVAEEAASDIYSKLLAILKKSEGGVDLLIAYDTLSRFETKNATISDIEDAQKAIKQIWEI